MDDDKTSKMIPVMDGFVKDENGKFHIVPMKLPLFRKPTTPGKKGDERRSTVRRKFIPIQPLVLTPADFGASPQNNGKRRKIDRPVRKELFKVPPKLPTSRISTSRRSFNRSQRNSFKNTNKIRVQNDDCALLDIDEAEKLLTKKTSLKGPIKTVLFPIVDHDEKESYIATDKPNTPRLNICDKMEKTPTSTESEKADLEFLELEKKLASVTKNKKIETASPMTSVCALLENTKITNTGKKSGKTVQSEILSILKEYRKQSQLFKQQIEQQIEDYHKVQDERLSRIEQVVTSVEDNKENTRRSLRLATQSVKDKFVTSPAIGNKVDLRKTTLNRNLSKNLQCESPRTRKATDMYNLIRNDCTALSTPKMDRSNFNLPQSSVTRSLSRRIQKQCLMLQDTPKISHIS